MCNVSFAIVLFCDDLALFLYLKFCCDDLASSSTAILLSTIFFSCDCSLMCLSLNRLTLLLECKR